MQEAEDRVPCAVPDMRSSVPAPETNSLSSLESCTQKASVSAGREGIRAFCTLQNARHKMCAPHTSPSPSQTRIPHSGRAEQMLVWMSARFLKEQHDKMNSKYVRLNTQGTLWMVELQNPEFPMEMDGSLGTKQVFLFLGHLGCPPHGFWFLGRVTSPQQWD